jgi:hypothetical protein
MKRVSWSIGLAAVILCGCVEKGSRSASDTPFFHLHWAGAASILKGGTNAAKLQEALKLPTTAQVRGEALAKLARVPQELWRKSLPADAPDTSASILQSILEDIWQNEATISLQGKPSQPDVFFAARLDAAKDESWNRALAQLAQNWKLGSASVEGPSAKWSVGRKDFYIHYARENGWTFAALTHSSKSPFGKSQPASLNGAIVDLRADWRRLGEAFPVLARYSLPPSHIRVMPRGEALRTEAKLAYSERLPIKLEPWAIPTNIVTEPIISFTCAQGIRPLLDQLKGFSKLRLKEPPNQYCAWGLATVHAQTFVSVPMSDATNVVKDIAGRLPEFVSAYFPNPPGTFLWISNRAEWIWSGLPLVIPHVRPARSGNQEFLVAGLFPAPGPSNAAPPELFAQVIGRTNLLYYDWELTDQRLPHARHTFQLSDIIAGRRNQETNFATQRWIGELAPLLGNTITEVTLSGPKELSLVRKSDVGLTGYELALLGRWIDSPRFPFQYAPPPMLKSGTNRPSRLTNPPVRTTNRPPQITNPPAQATNRPPESNKQ